MFTVTDLVDFSNGNNELPLSSSHVKDISYSCGSCGYELNLNSYNRNTSVIDHKYEKSMRRGIISFFSIDETRFFQTDEVQCIPYFKSLLSWGLFQRRTKLLCKKCNNYIGNAKKPRSSSRNSNKLKSASWDGISGALVTYDIRIRALQPSSFDRSTLSS